MGRVTDDEIARLDWHKGVLPPGPYRVEWPAEQGGAFTLWGRQGTPPDFKDGWAIPLVASGVDTAMYALRDILNGRSPGGPGVTSERDLGQQMVTKGGRLARDMEEYIERGSTGQLPAALAATPAPREDGWDELRREIEALPPTPYLHAAVLAIVDRLAAARGEPEIDVERLIRIEHAARDVDALWSEGRKLIRWQAEAGEALLDLRTALGSE